MQRKQMPMTAETAETPETADDFFERARQHIASGKNKDAVDDFTRAIALYGASDPAKLAEAYRLRGIAHSRCDFSFTKARADFNKAISLKKNYVDAYYGRACLYANESPMLAEAIRDFDHVLKLKSDCKPAQGHFEALLLSRDKSVIFAAIKRLPLNTQIALLEKCLNKNTLLGSRFWLQEGMDECSLDAGTLWEIKTYLMPLRMTHHFPEPTLVSAASSSNHIAPSDSFASRNAFRVVAPALSLSSSSVVAHSLFRKTLPDPKQEVPDITLFNPVCEDRMFTL